MRAPAKDAATAQRMRNVRRMRTGPEDVVARVLRTIGVGYRRNDRKLPGTPDFANRRRRFAIFVNGCFWHAHRGCARATVPKTNAPFWSQKLAGNRRRDATKIRALRSLGLRVIVVWECATRDPDTLRLRLSRVLLQTCPKREA